MGSMGARAEEPVTSLAISTGQYGMRKEVPHGVGLGVELRSPWRWSLFRPLAGVLTSSGGGTFLYSGVLVDIDLPLRFRLSPGFAPGIALAGAGSDLGFPVEFRSSVELSVAVGYRIRAGLTFSHISNARLGDRNPGVEVLALGISFPTRN